MGRYGIGAEGTCGEGFDLLYQFSRSMMPMLVGGDDGSSKKRKRERNNLCHYVIIVGLTIQPRMLY